MNLCPTTKYKDDTKISTQINMQLLHVGQDNHRSGCKAGGQNNHASRTVSQQENADFKLR